MRQVFQDDLEKLSLSEGNTEPSNVSGRLEGWTPALLITRAQNRALFTTIPIYEHNS